MFDYADKRWIRSIPQSYPTQARRLAVRNLLGGLVVGAALGVLFALAI